MNKVLITGGTGFIGSVVVKELLNYDIELYVIGRREICEDNLKLKYYQISIMDYDAINRFISEIKPDTLIHLAWNVNHSTYLNSDENLLWVGASLNLLRAFVKFGGKRVLMCGTCFEYEFSQEPYSEYKTPINPKSLYGVCKYNLYQIAKKYTDDVNVSFVWTRLGYLFGENESKTRVVPYIITNLLDGKVVICRNSNAVRDYIYVRDAGNAIVKTLISDVCGIVNIGSGVGIKMHDLFSVIAEKCGAANLVKYYDEGVDPNFLVLDTSILRNEVGYDSYASLPSALDNVIKWWKNERVKRGII